jgi:single-strand DNA-binding protein
MINSVVLAGNVVADPESRNTNSGKAVATFRLAVNNPINDKDVVYIDVDTWEKQAEFVGNYVKKGSSVSVVGRLKQDSWEKDGKKMTKTLVVAERVGFLGSKKKSEDAGSDEAPAPRAAKPAAKTYAKSAPKQAAQQDDDDIPI